MTKSRGILIRNPIERFWKFVSETPTSSGCIEWVGRKNYKGYGVMKIKCKSVQAHRFSWELYNKKEIPDGMCVCHHCDNRVCVNPEHLFLGTIQDNNNDRDMKGRKALGERNGKSKFTEKDVVEIKMMLSQGITCAEIARIFNSKHSTVHAIKIGRSWKWL